MKKEIRLTVVVVALAIAGVVALWPRGQAATSSPGRSSAAAVIAAPQPAPPAAAAQSGTLAQARQRAALRPCPAPGASAGSGPLAGIRVPCLGAPGSVDVAAALAGRPALLNVWASWCGPCRKEMPVLDAYATEPGAITLLGIDGTDNPSDALELMATLGVHYPSVVDVDGTLRQALAGPPILPASYLLLADGTVQRIVPPVVFDTTDEVHRVLARYLGPRG